jgi:hypothetical protein
MRSRLLNAGLALALAALACNLPSGLAAETPTATTESQPLPTLVSYTEAPSATPPPSDTPPPTLTPTPGVPIAWPKQVGVNCRLGPSTDWVVVGALLVEQTATIQGKNAAETWWYVATPNDPGTPCWVSGGVTNTAGNLASVPIVSPPEAAVIDVTVEKPATISVAGCMGPIQPMKLKGSIHVNGPTEVEWHFETEQGGALSTGTTDFAGAGSKDVADDSYAPPLVPGTYWVRLVVTSPNNRTGEASYKIVCP